MYFFRIDLYDFFKEIDCLLFVMYLVCKYLGEGLKVVI